MINEDIIKYYSANGEDFLLWQFFNFKQDGFYIDVGAFDGIHFSNTYSFEIQGWKGACVEPNPVFFPYLVKNRPASTCLQAACVSDMEKGQTTIFCEELGLLSSTNMTDDYEKFVKERFQKRGLVFDGFKQVTVPVITIDEAIARYLPDKTHIDLVSIDVEGAEIDVLKGFDARRHCPEIIVVESNNPTCTEEIVKYLETTHHYLYAGKLIENLFFARTKADVEKIRAIQVDCTIEPQVHPLGERFITEMYMNGRIISKEKNFRLKW